MSSFSLAGLTLEVVLGGVGVFLLFAPKLLDWSVGSYFGGILFLGLAFVALYMSH